jgi:SAM-dependent methyltransferase
MHYRIPQAILSHNPQTQIRIQKWQERCGRMEYIHGYSTRENRRLRDQASTLEELLHHDSLFPPGSRVLEAGCGVGAQTVIIAARNPRVRFLSMDRSAESLERASSLLSRRGIGNVEFAQADIRGLPHADETFDHVFVCFVLEHLPDPARALSSLRSVLKPGGSITVIEGDHGSAFFHPDSDAARRNIECLIRVQAALGGDPLIGRRLHPLLVSAGFSGVAVSPRLVYADDSRPAMVEGFTRNTFTAMVEGARDAAIQRGMIDEAAWGEGIAALNRTAAPGGTFCYTFFKAHAIKPVTGASRLH